MPSASAARAVLRAASLIQANATQYVRPGGFNATDSRYLYIDERGENGPVASFYLMASVSFRMKAVIEARGNNPSVDLVPPNPGTGGGMIATIPAGDRYCALFDPSLGAKISSQNDEELFRIGRTRNRGSCPPP